MKRILMTVLLSLIIIVLQGQEYLHNSQDYLEQGKKKKYNSPFYNEHYKQINSVYRFPQKSFLNVTPFINNRNTLKHQLDSIVVKEWNDVLNQWIYLTRENYDYDGNGNMVTSETQDYNNNQWINIWSGKYSYDTNNNMTSIIYFDWNNHASQWEEGYKEEFVYDSLGKVSSYYAFNWENTTNQWINDLKNEVNFDNNGNRLLDTRYNWDAENNQWVIDAKYEYEYNENGNLTTCILYSWSEILNIWEEYWKDIYTYSNDNMVEDSAFSWDSNNNDWRLSTIYEFEYDINNNLIQRIMIDAFFGQNVYEYKNVFDYESSIPNSSLVIPWWWKNEYWWWWDGQWAPNMFNSMLIEFAEFEFNNDVWDLSEKGFCYYSEVNLQGIELPQIVEFNVFPNPATDFIKISWTVDYHDLQLQIYNLLGHLVMDKTITNEESVLINDLNSGLYIFKLTKNNQLLGNGKIYIK
ncbi:MAG: T9SS type A sorting domain-containing protein [Bacteroidales bacterium]|nr:T9SS type A sorting domain-containing protein [Bacteroidales bacterium]